MEMLIVEKYVKDDLHNNSTKRTKFCFVNEESSLIAQPNHYSTARRNSDKMAETSLSSLSTLMARTSPYAKESSTSSSSTAPMTEDAGQESSLESKQTLESVEDYFNDNFILGQNEINPILPTDIIPQDVTGFTVHKSKLRLLPLAILVFYNVSGGPFGIEPSIHSAGNLYTIIGFIVVPFIWSIPEALITAELGSVFCQDGSGGVAWVDEAFGEKWGLVCGYLSWISGATDNAIYPTLFLQYLISVLQSKDDNDNEEFWLENNYVRFGFVSILSILLGLLNYRGLEIVGNASIVVCVVAMSPFIIMIIIGIPKIDPSRWLQLPDCNATTYYDDNDFASDDMHDQNCGMQNAASSFLDDIFGGRKGVLWAPFLNNMFWNFNSFDAASNFASEVNSVSTTYPNGIFLGLILSIAFYLIPLLVVTGATNYAQNEWTDGQLGKAAVDLGGNWLGTWIVFAAGISNLALFEAELSSDSYQLMGMADRGHLPRIFATRSKFGTPTYGISVGIIVIIIMSMADFTELVELLNFNYAIALLMEYAAFVKLRWTRKDLNRPYRIPIPDWCALPMVIPPLFGIIVVFSVASWTTYIFVLIAFFLGVICHYFLRLSKMRHWLTFVDRYTIRNPLNENSEDSLENDNILII